MVPCSLLSRARIRIHHGPDFDVMRTLHSVVQDMMVIHVQVAVVLLHAMFPAPMLQPQHPTGKINPHLGDPKKQSLDDAVWHLGQREGHRMLAT